MTVEHLNWLPFDVNFSQFTPNAVRDHHLQAQEKELCRKNAASDAAKGDVNRRETAETGGKQRQELF